MTDPRQEVDQFVTSLASKNKKIVEQLRDIIRATIPEVVEEIKWGHPVYTYRGLLCYISPAKNYVSFGFFKGIKLSDPDDFLEGSGDKLRHIKITSPDEIMDNQFKQWIMQAAELNESH